MHDIRVHFICIDVEIERVPHGAVAGFLCCLHHITLRSGQTGESVGEIGVAGRVGVQRRVFIVLIKHLVHHVLHTAHFRHLDLHSPRAITTSVDGRSDQVEGTHCGISRQLEVVSFPIRSCCARGARRFCICFHHIVALGQIEERDAVVRTGAALRAERRVEIRARIELERGFGEARGAAQVGLHPTTRTGTVTGGGCIGDQRDVLRVARADTSHGPTAGAPSATALGDDAHVNVRTGQ